MRRPSISHVHSLNPLHTRCQIPSFIGKLLSEMLGDLCSCCDPHVFFTGYVFYYFFKSAEAAGFAYAAAVEGYGHHFWGAISAFVVEGIEGVLYVRVEIIWS